MSNHWWRVIGGSVLLALTSVGALSAESASPPAAGAPAAAPQPPSVPSRKPAPDSAPVSWKEATRQGTIHFATDVVPIFTKIGCNQGACHGAAVGKGGFHLSLRGWDPAFDWEQIVKDATASGSTRSTPRRAWSS